MKRRYLILFFAVTFIFHCQSLPKGYVKAEEVVFLKQNVSLKPIRYTPSLVQPYRFTANVQVNAQQPQFLGSQFSNLLQPDFLADAKLYQEIRGHLDYIKNSSAFKSLKGQVDSGGGKPLTNGTYIENSYGKIVKLQGQGGAANQYQYTLSGSGHQYVFFYSNGFEKLVSSALIRSDRVRFSKQMQNDLVSVYGSNEMIVINNKFHKSHYRFNPATLQQGKFLSFYLPEGIRITDFDQKHTTTTVKPNWPEGYKMKNVEGFNLIYSPKDEKYLAKLSNQKL